MTMTIKDLTQSTRPIFLQSTIDKDNTIKLNKYQSMKVKNKPLHLLGGVYASSLLFMTYNECYYYCVNCASKHTNDIEYHTIIWEGEGAYCDSCSEIVESVYGNEGDDFE